ncbi:MAG TPA: acetylxylan esterase [Chthoniobacterales bacterium]
MQDHIFSARGDFKMPQFTCDAPFDPAYGYQFDDLLKIDPPEPAADFADFWRQFYAEARKVAPQPVISRRVGQDATHFIHEIRYRAFGGVIISGWLAIPRLEKPKCAFVIGHGYGGRYSASGAEIPRQDAVALFPCLRGLARSPVNGMLKNSSFDHVVWGIHSRETYVHGGNAADLWGAASAILTLFPETIGRIVYVGASFGGGIGTLMLPWDDRFSAGWVEVPSFGNHPLRVKMQCWGSGRVIRDHWLRNPEVLKVLQYFDSAIAARFLKRPLGIMAALYDPSVPPPGQFSIFNATPSTKRLCVTSAGHYTYPAEASERQLTDDFRDRFLADVLA